MTLQQHLELICKHLPHKVMYSHNGNVAELMPYHLGMHLKNIERGDDWNLCLRPLSDLVKPCLEDGKIPIVELAKLAFFKTEGAELCGNFARLEDGYSFHFSNNTDGVCFSCRKGYDGKRWDYSCFVPNQLQLFDKLHQWGFYLGDQSLFGKEIIDINTLK
jgi:hypothetical protein